MLKFIKNIFVKPLSEGSQLTETSPKEKQETSSHQQGPNYIDLSLVKKTSLPPPPKIETNQKSPDVLKALNKKDDFQIFSSEGWLLEKSEVIPMAERPSRTIHKIYPYKDGILIINRVKHDEGRRIAFTTVIQRRNKKGLIDKSVELNYEIFRIGINPDKSNFILASRDCTIYLFDGELNLLNQIPLKVSDAAYLRSISLSDTNERFAYSIIDNVYLSDLAGKKYWKLTMPPKSGWNPILTSSVKLTPEEKAAIELFSLSVPFSLEDLKSKYRSYAREYHPDLHRGDVNLDEKMKQINLAFSTLSGSKGLSWLEEKESYSYAKEMWRQEIEIPGASKITLTASMSMGIGGDWIYQVEISDFHESIYIGSYSGKIIKLNYRGFAQEIFDIGVVPEDIIAIKDNIIIRADQRLYILSCSSIRSIIDFNKDEEVLIFTIGLILVSDRRIRYFDFDGKLRGEILSAKPLYQIYQIENKLIIETRQNRAAISGSPHWWN